MDVIEVLLTGAYIVGTYVFWRNISFPQPRKALFCLSILPLVFATMFINIWLVNRYFPELMDMLAQAKVHDAQVRAQLGYVPRRSGQEAPVAFLIATPLSGIVGYCWYLFLKVWGRQSAGA